MPVRRIPAAEVKTVVQAGANTGEGPVWDDREAVLWWVDIPAGLLHRFDPASGLDTAMNVGQQVGAVALRAGGGLVLALSSGFATFADGHLQMIAEVEADDPGMRMNDGYCDPQGRFWAGTMAIDGRGAVGTLYRLDPDGSVHPMVTGREISNGIDWSPDGRVMYYADTPTHRVEAYEFDGATGEIANPRTFIEHKEDCDGLVVDADGMVWVALWGGWAVNRYTPDGELDTVIELPTAHITKPAFGGSDLSDLYITSATKELSGSELANQPEAGNVFRVRCGIRGQRPRYFAG